MKLFSFRIAFTQLLIVLVGVACAQDNLKRGYITCLDGEIVHGFIDVSNWRMNP